MNPSPASPVPETLHPALWRAHQLGRRRERALATGFAPLDAELPGGGWPQGCLTELLLAHPGVGELRLLAPMLAALGRSVVCVDPPARLCGWSLRALGLDLRQWVVVQAQGNALKTADKLWALEQALRSGRVGALLAWLPDRLPADALRRLQLAAQAHEGPALLFRGESARLRPSPAPLRLLLGVAGVDELRVQVLKRRGAPLAQALHLTLAPVLSKAGRARAEQGLPRPSTAPVQARERFTA